MVEIFCTRKYLISINNQQQYLNKLDENDGNFSHELFIKVLLSGGHKF